MLEQLLRTHRDAALKLLSENQDRVREGIELVVQEKMPAILRAAKTGGTMPEQQAERLYAEVLALAYSMFALGYTISHTGKAETANR